MAKRKIHLTEKRLRRLIEQSINELDANTYKNAARKKAQQISDLLDDPETRKWMSSDYAWMKSPTRKKLNQLIKSYELLYNMSTKGNTPDNFRDSYYDRDLGRWLNLNDKDFDDEKGRQFLKEQGFGESIVRRVTESVKRRLLKEWESDRWYRSVEDDIIDQIEESSLDNESPLPKEDEADVEGFIDSKRRAEGHAEWTIEEDGTVSDVYINLEIAGSRKSSYAETYECDMEYTVQKLAQKGITVVL